MLLETYVRFYILVQFVCLSGRLLGNSCSLGLRYVFLVKVPMCHFSFFFSPLCLWSGNFFLIAPFPDHCLLVPFYLTVVQGDKNLIDHFFKKDCQCSKDHQGTWKSNQKLR